MSDLTDFLLARVAEDQQRISDSMDDPEIRLPADWLLQLHAECDAKRRVAEAYVGLREVARTLGRPTSSPDERGQADVARNMYAGVELAMQALSLPYAAHPDYRSEWKP